MESNIAFFADNGVANSVAIPTKKEVKYRSVEAALMTAPGRRALIDAAPQSALNKAVAGRYRPAAEILGDAFPKVIKARAELGHGMGWENKAEFCRLLTEIERQKPGKSGNWTKTQIAARYLLAQLRETFPRECSEDTFEA